MEFGYFVSVTYIYKVFYYCMCLQKVIQLLIQYENYEKRIVKILKRTFKHLELSIIFYKKKSQQQICLYFIGKWNEINFLYFSFISDNRIHSIKVHRFLHINVKGKIHNTIAYTYIHLYTEHNNKKNWETMTKTNHPLSPAYFRSICNI